MGFKISYPNLETALKAQKMFELRHQVLLSVMDGKYRTARKLQKEVAKTAVEDFDTYKTLPKINFSNVPFKLWLSLGLKSLKFRIYRAFTRNTPEEKLLAKKYKTYMKELNKENKKIPTVDITIPSLY